MSDTTPTIHYELIITGHQYTPIHERVKEPTMVKVLLHRGVYLANDAPDATTLITRDDLANPAYHLGAIWKCVYTGENLDQREYED